eukprot:scaffold17130_cov78-Skeletonema_dohrnii-CCMP3373.AAC.1
MANYNGPLQAVDCHTRSVTYDDVALPLISNGFVFGSILANITANDEVTEEMWAILSPFDLLVTSLPTQQGLIGMTPTQKQIVKDRARLDAEK